MKTIQNDDEKTNTPVIEKLIPGDVVCVFWHDTMHVGHMPLDEALMDLDFPNQGGATTWGVVLDKNAYGLWVATTLPQREVDNMLELFCIPLGSVKTVWRLYHVTLHPWVSQTVERMRNYAHPIAIPSNTSNPSGLLGVPNQPGGIP